MLLLSDNPPPTTPTSVLAGPELGVIEEARRRQRARRTRIAISAFSVAALVVIALWALNDGTSHASFAHSGDVNRTVANTSRAAFNVRLVPALTVGQAGWCAVIEESGRTGGEACGGVPLPAQPILQAQSSYSSGATYATTVVVSGPQVAAILANNTLRSPTLSLPGLPYGLRGALIRIPVNRAQQTLPGARLRSSPADPILVALNAQGLAIPPKEHERTPLQATVRSWRYPNRPVSGGSCQLHASLPGLSARSGEVSSAIKPFPGRLIGHAFLPCAATVYYLRHMPLKAMVILDAAHPRARAAALPDFKPVPRTRGIFAEGGLTARRFANAWLIVGQGSGLTQRLHLLHHLTATIKL